MKTVWSRMFAIASATIAVALIAACSTPVAPSGGQPIGGGSTPATTPVSSVEDTQATLVGAAHDALRAFSAHDADALAALVHPTKGVRFTINAHVDVKADVVMQRAQIADFWTSAKIYRWGVQDATGDPIRSTPAAFSKSYLNDRDYVRDSVLTVNADRGSGTILSNIAEAYPGSSHVEFFIEPTMAGGQPGNDWAALRLVFERLDGKWYLVGVVHAAWTS